MLCGGLFMKKLFTLLLASSAILATSCQATDYTASEAASKLRGNSYTVEVMSYDQAKQRIIGLNYDIVDFRDAVYAEKGEEENHDLLVAFFFSSIDNAEKFLNENNYENLTLLNRYGERYIGENLVKKVGMHNNVAYVGTETSFAAAFN